MKSKQKEIEKILRKISAEISYMEFDEEGVSYDDDKFVVVDKEQLKLLIEEPCYNPGYLPPEDLSSEEIWNNVADDLGLYCVGQYMYSKIWMEK